MKKVFIPWMACLMMLTLAPSVFAHTTLESSKPLEGQVVEEELQELILTFAGQIEKGSYFEITDADHQSVKVNEFILGEKQLTGIFAAPLNNGEYQVDWSIISADGHEITGSYTFSVQLPATEQISEEEAEVESDIQPVNAEEKQIADQDDNNSTSILVVIAAVIVAAVGVVFYSLRRSNK